MSRNAVAVWDFTSFDVSDKDDYEKFKLALKEKGKEWAFQLEETAAGKLHAQGRVSLRRKTRKPSGLFDWTAHWTPSSNGVSGWSGTGRSNGDGTDNCSNTDASNGKQMNLEYCVKQRTRVAGPWRSIDQPSYIPRQYRVALDRPFQRSIRQICKVWDDRTINVLYCPVGNKGKSVCAHVMRLVDNAIILPVINDARDIIHAACDQLRGKQIRQPGGVFLDMPRAMNKDRLYGIYCAIEQVKSGWVYDTRHKWKEWDFDSPVIWVFTNRLPDQSMMSRDRWKIWTINDDLELVDYVDELDFIVDD